MCWRICSPILCFVFLFCWQISLLCKKKFSSMKSHLFIYFLFPLPKETYQITYCYEQYLRLCCLFSSRIFIVLGLTFKSLIHFEFVLVYGVRRWSGFIFLHISVQFSQLYLLNKLSLAHFMCSLPLSNIIDYNVLGLFLGY